MTTLDHNADGSPHRMRALGWLLAAVMCLAFWAAIISGLLVVVHHLA